MSEDSLKIKELAEVINEYSESNYKLRTFVSDLQASLKVIIKTAESDVLTDSKLGIIIRTAKNSLKDPRNDK